MAIFSLITLLVTLRLFLLVSGAPAPVPAAEDAAATSYWLSSIQRQGTVAYGDANYQIFRNVQDFGAKGDGMLFSLISRQVNYSQQNHC